MYIIRTALLILVELIDLVNSVIIFVSQMTLLGWLTFPLGRAFMRRGHLKEGGIHKLFLILGGTFIGGFTVLRIQAFSGIFRMLCNALILRTQSYSEFWHA